MENLHTKNFSFKIKLLKVSNLSHQNTLVNLTALDLRANQLTSLPETIGDLKSLRFLDLRDNNLKSLPASIRNLKHLEKIDVRLNKGLIIPEWFHELEQRGCTVFY